MLRHSSTTRHPLLSPHINQHCARQPPRNTTDRLTQHALLLYPIPVSLSSKTIRKNTCGPSRMRLFVSIMLLGVAGTPLTGNERVELQHNTKECENGECKPPYESPYPTRWVWGPRWLETVSYPGYVLDYGHAQSIHDERPASTSREKDDVCRPRPTSFFQVPIESSKLEVTSPPQMQDELLNKRSFDCLGPGGKDLLLKSAT